ncbi:hypothetical protein LWI29_007100 [Acer saccharum]|uniref:Uncharacterized protein n=1 Tax=Acer saccharum TaxID=4024 RepID=A0AA39VH02_ACESA|nr:hypothetical protein LWI29_007100 [Acer saccharum]
MSNSRKQQLLEAPKKDQNLKASVVAEEDLNLNAIAEERFFHNHQECIKCRTEPMDDVEQDQNSKVSVVAEEDLDLDAFAEEMAFAEERIFHNHQECIKLQALQMEEDDDLFEVPEAVGLRKRFPNGIRFPNGFTKESTSSSEVVPPGGLIELQFSDPQRFMDLMEAEEMQQRLEKEIQDKIEVRLKETKNNWWFIRR